jgi:hypothetical protein
LTKKHLGPWRKLRPDLHFGGAESQIGVAIVARAVMDDPLSDAAQPLLSGTGA